MIGEISSATLGYIVGDVPGAVIAYNLFNKYSLYKKVK